MKTDKVKLKQEPRGIRNQVRQRKESSVLIHEQEGKRKAVAHDSAGTRSQLAKTTRRKVKSYTISTQARRRWCLRNFLLDNFSNDLLVCKRRKERHLRHAGGKQSKEERGLILILKNIQQ